MEHGHSCPCYRGAVQPANHLNGLENPFSIFGGTFCLTSPHLSHLLEFLRGVAAGGGGGEVVGESSEDFAVVGS